MSDLLRLWQALEAVRRRYTEHALSCRYCSTSDFRCAEGVELVFDAMRADSQFEAAIPEGMRA